MTEKKASQLLVFLIAPLSISLGLLPFGAVQAQSTSSETVIFQPNGSPRNTSGGASRGGPSRGVCTTTQAGTPQSQRRIIALIPATDTELTTEAHPTVFVYIPNSTAQKAEFSLWDENDNGLYQTTISLPNQSGIVSFKLPEDAPPLAVDKRYKWSIAAICDPNQRSRDVVVEGWIKRTQLNSALTQQLTSVDPLQQAKLYAQNKVWYEALATLAQLRRSRPSDSSIAVEWQQLLQSVGLKDVVQAPLVNCCEVQN